MAITTSIAAAAATIEPATVAAPLGFVSGVVEGRGVPAGGRRVLLEPESVLLPPFPAEPAPAGVPRVEEPAKLELGDPELLGLGMSTLQPSSRE